MLEIDRIPTWVTDKIKEAGIAPQLAARCDRTREQEPGEVFLLADLQSLYVLDRESRPLEQYPLRELSNIAVEEQRSTGRLLARFREDTVLLASFTNFCKESVLLFVKYLKRLAQGEPIEPDPKDLPSSKCCPRVRLGLSQPWEF